MWLVLLGFHLVGMVGFNLMLRRSVLEKADKLTLATLLQIGIAVPALVLLAVHPPDLRQYSPADFLYLACTIPLTIALQATNVKALQYLEASVMSIIYNLRIILATALGILFLSEDFVWIRIAGGLLILAAIIIVKQKGSKSLRAKGIAWGLAAAVIISFLNTFEKLLLGDVGFINYFPIVSVLCAAIMWLYILGKRQTFNHALLLQPRMIQLMALRSLSAYGFTGALAAGALVSVANYISGMSVIFMVVLGAVLLNERDYLMRKAAAALVAVAGLTLVLLSHL